MLTGKWAQYLTQENTEEHLISSDFVSHQLRCVRA